MNLLGNFSKEFNKRHDFDSSDLDIFLNRWKNKANFENIPVAWIIPLDTMMFELNKLNLKIKNVKQLYGQCIVQYSIDINKLSLFNKAKNIINVAKNKIKSIDVDLYEVFDIEYIDKAIKLHSKLDNNNYLQNLHDKEEYADFENIKNKLIKDFEDSKVNYKGFN